MTETPEADLERRFRHPAWNGTSPPSAPGDLEERVREWAREEVLAWMKEMEKTLQENLRTLAETDARIIRELRSLQERRAPPRGPGAN